MKRGKKLLSLLLILAMVVTMAACGTEKDTKKNETKVTPTSAPTEEAKPTATATPTEEPTPTPTNTPTPTPTVEPWPAKNCEILFPERELYHYDMDLLLDPENRTVGGHVVFTFYNDSKDSWNELCLRDYSSHFIDAKTAGYDPKRYTPNGALTEIANVSDSRNEGTLDVERDKDASVVWLKLKTPLAPGEKMTLTYDFTAKIPTVPDRYGVYEDVYNVTNFYPILAEYDKNGWSHEGFINCGECFYSEVSDYDVRLTVPKGYLVATTGTESDKKEEGDKVVYTLKAPCVRDFVFSASDQFVVHEADYDGVHVKLMYNKKLDSEIIWSVDSPIKIDMSDAAAATMDAARDSLAAFGEALGRYPYDELDIVIAKIDAGGMEYPNMIIITDDEIYPIGVFNYSDDMQGDKEPDAKDFTPSFEQLTTCVAHEIGHQWFMGIVGSNSGMEPWLDESITSYTELIYEEYLWAKSGKGDKPIYLMRHSRQTTDLCDVTQLKYMMQRGMIPLNQSYYEFKEDSDYISAIYQEGQTTLYQMEEILGHDEFQSVLREYVRRNAFTNSTTARFFEVLFEYAGHDNADLNKLIDNMFDLDRAK
ncbi:MAG: M1 family metallopeptidase [Lachnospiraceae bacterium]|nr:M1 family metallopeptidase [Lachnospiraceae bacterium]